jgi:lysophospholipase L1-like esterase
LTGEQSSSGINVPPQVEQIDNRIGKRLIDTLLVSIGGNDVGFSNVLTNCVEDEPCLELCPDGISVCGGTGYGIYEAGLAEFTGTGSGSVNDLQDKLLTLLGDRLPASSVYFTAYPDMLMDDDGSTCKQNPADIFSTLPNFSNPEMKAAQVITGEMNGQIETSVASYGWNFISTIPVAMANHGYCADDHWIVRLSETFQIQGDKSGMVHPNIKGHQAYAKEISEVIIPELIPVRNEVVVSTYLEPPAESGAGSLNLAWILVLLGCLAASRRNFISRSHAPLGNA